MAYSVEEIERIIQVMRSNHVASIKTSELELRLYETPEKIEEEEGMPLIHHEFSHGQIVDWRNIVIPNVGITNA